MRKWLPRPNELKASDDAKAIADGLHDIAAAIREHTACLVGPEAEEEPPEQNTYLDGSPRDA